MYQLGPGLERRLTDLQAQIDRLTEALQVWQNREDRLQPAERRLLQLTDRCAEILEQWTLAGARHAEALSAIQTSLDSLNALESRVQHDAAERIERLERAIAQEWDALRQLHEEPVRQLREQAASLADVCVTAASSTERGLERAEARLATLESDLQRQMAELARELRSVAAALASAAERPAATLPDGAQAWPLEGVMRLHEQLRQGKGRAGSASPAEAGDAPASPSPGAGAAAALPAVSSDVEAGPPRADLPVAFASEAPPAARTGHYWSALVALVVFAMAGGGALAWQLQRRIADASARAAEAERRAQLATDVANRQLQAVRDAAAQEMAAARDAAQKAQTMSSVLAAPDVVRFNLAGGGDAGRPSAQMLWSRSRGFVFSGSRLPAPPAGSTYQIWLMTAGDPVSAGTFLPDSSGRATIASDAPPRVPRPVVDIRVTVEPEGGRPAPSGAVVLQRAVPRPPAPQD